MDKKLSKAGRLMRLVNSEAQQEAARKNGAQGGAPKLCACGHKRNLHARFGDEWKQCGECECREYAPLGAEGKR